MTNTWARDKRKCHEQGNRFFCCFISANNFPGNNVLSLYACFLPVQPLLSLLDVNPFPVNSNHIPRSTNPKLILRRSVYLFIYFFFFLQIPIRKTNTPHNNTTNRPNKDCTPEARRKQREHSNLRFRPLHHHSFFGFITVDVDRVSHVVIKLSKYKCL